MVEGIGGGPGERVGGSDGLGAGKNLGVGEHFRMRLMTDA